MKRLLLLISIICYSIGLNGQSNDAYSDEDLKNYLQIGQSMMLYRMELKTKADSMRQAEGLDENVFLEILEKTKHQPYDSVKELYSKEEIAAFEKTMSYRRFLREGMKLKLNGELAKVGWDIDFYEHLVLSIEAIPELQERIIKLSK